MQMKCIPPPFPSPAEEDTFSCQVPSFSPLVLLADRHWKMPYRSWQPSPSSPDSTLLTVNGAHLQVKVEIKVGTADLLLSLTHSPSRPHTSKGKARMCACVDAVLVQCDDALYSHSTYAHSPSGGQLSSSATAKASAIRVRGRGGGGGGASPEQDGQSVDEYQGPHEVVCVCVCMCVRACVMSNAFLCLCVRCV